MRSIKSLFVRSKQPPIVGRVVAVGLPQFGIEAVTAKIDSGAFSGALHATNIREVKKRGRHQLEFIPLNNDGKPVRTAKFSKKRVKSSNGAIADRYVIDTKLRIFDQLLPITITLTDRAAMKHPIIIGRKFLRTHGFLIDVSSDTQ
jgi:hypothetical protein